MPAKSPSQLRAAYAAASRGEAWGKEMTSATPDELKKRWMSGSHPKKVHRPVKKAKAVKKAHKRVRSKK